MCPSIGRMDCQICGRFLEHRPSMVGYVICTVHINGSSTPHVWTLTPNLLWPSLEPGRCVIHCFIVHQRQGKRWGELSTSISGGKGKSREIRLFGKCRHKEKWIPGKEKEEFMHYLIRSETRTFWRGPHLWMMMKWFINFHRRLKTRSADPDRLSWVDSNYLKIWVLEQQIYLDSRKGHF